MEGSDFLQLTTAILIPGLGTTNKGETTNKQSKWQLIFLKTNFKTHTRQEKNLGK